MNYTRCILFFLLFIFSFSLNATPYAPRPSAPETEVSKTKEERKEDRKMDKAIKKELKKQKTLKDKTNNRP